MLTFFIYYYTSIFGWKICASSKNSSICTKHNFYVRERKDFLQIQLKYRNVLQIFSKEKVPHKIDF